LKVIIIGGGQVGEYIARLLLHNDCHVKIIEYREDVFEKLSKQLPQHNIIYGNGTDPDTLEFAGIANADVVAAVTGADEANLVASTIAKFEFNVPRIIARVNNPKNAWLFNAGMGVDVALNQADLLAYMVVEEIDFKNMLMLMKINHGAYSIVRMEVDENSEAADKLVSDLPIPSDAVLIGVYRGEEIIIPHGDTRIIGGDNILIFANEEARAKINELFKSVK